MMKDSFFLFLLAALLFLVLWARARLRRAVFKKAASPPAGENPRNSPPP